MAMTKMTRANPTSTNGAECGAHPATVDAQSLPGPPKTAFQRILEQAQIQVNELMQLPMYQSDDEGQVKQYRQQLLKERLAVLETKQADVEKLTTDAYNNNQAFQQSTRALIGALDQQGATVAQAVNSQASAVHELSNHLFTDPIRIRSNPEMSMERLAATGLSLKQQKDLVSMITCLAREGEVPAKQDLSMFWAKVERAVKSLDSNMILDDLEHEHISHLGPLILGDMIWAEFKHQEFFDWDDFKKAVDDKYGMTHDELIDAFYEMSPAKNETTPDFILRVERLRARYGEDAKTCFRQFKTKLDVEYRRGLTHLRRAAAIMGKAPDLTWEMIVADARSQTTYSSLLPEDTQQVIQGFGQPDISAPPKGIPAALPAPQTIAPVRRGTSKSLFADASFASTERHCSLCALVGRRTAHTHDLDHCYSNPKNPKSQPWSVRLRYNDIVDKKLAVPDCMKDFAREQEGRWDAAKKPEAKEDKPAEPAQPKLDAQMLSQFGDDLHALCEQGVDYDEAVQRAALVNFDYDATMLAQDVAPDPTPSFMLFHQDEEPDLQAISQTTSNHQQALLKRHLQALNSFPDEDIQAALHDLNLADISTSAVQRSVNYEEAEDASMDSESEDDIPLAQLPTRQATSTLQKPSYSPTPFPPVPTLSGEMSTQTGMPEYGRRVIKAKKKREPTLGQEVSKMKILLPLFKGLQVKANLRKLVMAKSSMEAYKKGDTINVVAGTKVREVSEATLQREIEIYSDAGIDENVRHKLKEVRRATRNDKTHMIHEIADSLKELLNKIDAATSPPDSVDKPDQTMMSMPAIDSLTPSVQTEQDLTLTQDYSPAHLVVVSPLPEEAGSLPDWASDESVNAQLITKVSPSHYTALCGMGKGVCNVLLDTAGARTMIDLQTAELVGLPVERTTPSKYFGSFISATAVPTPYAGRVKGPISLRFSANVEINIKEMKVIDYPEPLVLIGSDVLGAHRTQGYSFTTIGINPRTQKGELTFAAQSGRILEVCELVRCPEASGIMSTSAPQKKVTFAEPLDQPNSPLQLAVQAPLEGVEKSKRLLALVKNRGRYVR